jgi:hypothetical protein
MRIALCSLLAAVCLIIQQPVVLADSAYAYFTRTSLLSEEQKQVISRLHRLDKPIDEETHRQFWALFPDEDRRAWIEAEQSGRSKADSILLYDRIEAAFWQSMYETVRNGKTTKVLALDELWAKAPVNRYDENDRWFNYLRRQDKWLDLNWLRNSKVTARYPLHAFANMNEARFGLRQMEMLLYSKWDEKAKIWPYPPMNFDLSWPHPWIVSQAVLCGADCKFWNLRPLPLENHPVAIYFMAEPREGFDPLQSKEIRAGINIMTDAGVYFEVIGQQRLDADWQGHRSVTFRSRLALHSDKPLYSLSRVVFEPHSNALLIFVAWSTTSSDDAQRQFDVMIGAATLH